MTEETEVRYRVLQPSDLGADILSRRFAVDVLRGLSERPKRLPSRWFYDETGSRLFEQICDLDEYYLTRTETSILRQHADRILADAEGAALSIVDLGAGDGRKTDILLAAAAGLADVSYVPIDISETAMARLVGAVSGRYPRMAVGGVVGEYFDGLHWLAQSSERRSLVLFLGSNIGNFDAVNARNFLRQLWDALKHGDLLLIGFDLKKDIELLLAAYNDRQGVTAAFNLNLLARINRDLEADFDLSAFRHFATYNVFSGAMESYLVSRRAQAVKVGALQQAFEFAPWEPIHTEYSYKYLEEDIESLAAETGFSIVDRFYDGRGWFVDALWRVEKPGLG
jgi:dimethylhistidine N-methyltransferase